jgi:uncharacterized protein (DUF1015 family)
MYVSKYYSIPDICTIYIKILSLPCSISGGCIAKYGFLEQTRPNEVNEYEAWNADFITSQTRSIFALDMKSKEDMFTLLTNIADTNKTTYIISSEYSDFIINLIVFFHS